MSIIPALLKEMEQEAKTTRKMLERVPVDKYDWQPHPKSMTLRALATHVAEIPSWVKLVLTTDELDFAKTPYNPPMINTNEEMIGYFEESYEAGYSVLSGATDKSLEGNWTVRGGDDIYSVLSRPEMLRVCYCQIVHHRAQLGVYLRLLDIPIPGSYGPSADEQ